MVGCRIGGAERDRTADLRLAKPALSHLSYCPTSFHRWISECAIRTGRKGIQGLDLPAAGCRGGICNLLSNLLMEASNEVKNSYNSGPSQFTLGHGHLVEWCRSTPVATCEGMKAALPDHGAGSGNQAISRSSSRESSTSVAAWLFSRSWRLRTCISTRE